MKNRFESLWVEKYRPQTLEDLCVSDENKSIIKSFTNEIPNLLLTGNAGCGKTTLARIIVLDILKCDYLYINASDENGVDTIRSKITGFVQTKSFDGGIKVVVLDEADGLSNAAQGILRNLMESYANNARFILTGNHKHKISAPLQSRCQSLYLKPTLSQALKRCLSILKTENITTSSEQKQQLASLVKSHFPDLRKCINEMQKVCIDSVLTIGRKIDNNPICDKIYQHLSTKKTLELRKYLIQNDGLFNSDWEQLLTDLLNYIYKSPVLDDSKKKAMVLTIADHLEKCSRVNDKEINFFACVLNLENI